MEFPFDSFTERDWQIDDDPGTLRLAMVGLGWWTLEEAIPAVADSDFCETTVLASSSAERARAGGHGPRRVDRARRELRRVPRGRGR